MCAFFKRKLDTQQSTQKTVGKINIHSAEVKYQLKMIHLTEKDLGLLKDFVETPTAKAASRLTSVGFLLPKAKSISGIADVQDEGISLPLPIQCV